MPNRFTDSEKWNDPWFSELSNDDKIIWLYIVDACTYYGVYKVNYRNIRFHCRTEKTDDQIREIVKSRIIEFQPDKWFIPKFLSFQYPKGLQSNKPAIRGIRNALIKNGLAEIVIKTLGPDYDVSGGIPNEPQAKPLSGAKNKLTYDQFTAELLALKTPSNADYVRNFSIYWTEKNDMGLMRFQLQEFWDTKKRFQSWIEKNR